MVIDFSTLWSNFQSSEAFDFISNQKFSISELPCNKHINTEKILVRNRNEKKKQFRSSSYFFLFLVSVSREVIACRLSSKNPVSLKITL